MSAATEHRPVVWSVAGSDSGGGAGLQADLRAFEAFGVHGCSVVAAITAQNSVAVSRAEAVAADLVDAQLEALAEDLFPAALKTGLLGSADNARRVAAQTDTLRRRAALALVVDPVRRATTGATFADAALREVYRDALLPRATVLTPNRDEAAWLLGMSRLDDDTSVAQAARALRERGAGAVVITGGDAGGSESRDFAATPQAEGWLVQRRIATPHHHGSGCTFAAAIAAALALGFCEADAIVLGKLAAAQGLRRAGPAGAGAGPVRPDTRFAAERADFPVWLDTLDAWRPAAAFAPTGSAPLGLYAIVDSAAAVERVARAGVPTVQLRIKQADAGTLAAEVACAVAAARRHGVRLFVNDHWALALQHGAYGVHLGQTDLAGADPAALHAAGLRVGISTHAPWEVARALAWRPSYIACGPVFPTPTKRMPWAPQGAHNLRYWSARLDVPLVAIGGLDVPRAALAAGCGADGVAVLRGIAGAPDVPAAVAAYRGAIASAPAAPGPAPLRPLPTLAAGGTA